LVLVEDTEALLLIDDILFTIASGLASAALLYAAWRSEGRSKSAWKALAAAQIAYTLGEVVYTVMEVGFHLYLFPSGRRFLPHVLLLSSPGILLLPLSSPRGGLDADAEL
jgi:hypothetical protein